MPTATKNAAKTRSAAAELTIDYPQPKDVVLSTAYTMRIGAVDRVDAVEVSVDGGPWQSCRSAVGYWWFDWSGYMAGRHELSARGRRSDGREVSTSQRQFSVELE